MSFDLDRLYRLLPAIYRIRDAQEGDGEQGGPLRALLAVIAGEVAVLEENLAQLYDDQFIETCAEWVVPYMGDLLGVSGLQAIRSSAFSQRAFVANTLAYRQRKGTALALEQLARDVTDWNAHVVEFFQLLATTQSMHHLRPTNLATADLRKWEPLERLNTPFDSLTRNVDVRRIATSTRARYNIPNIGIFLWRLQAYPTSASPAFQVDAHRYLFSPLGNNIPLFTNPATRAEFARLSGPLDVPEPISRRLLDAYLTSYYGKDLSILLAIGEGKDAVQITADRISSCDLSDVKDAQGNITGWAHMPPAGGKIAIDPVLGRIALPAGKTAGDLRVTFYYGFSTKMGGGEYERFTTFDPGLQLLSVQQVPEPNVTIQAALDVLRQAALTGRSKEHPQAGNGVVEIKDNHRYQEALSINLVSGERVELRAADVQRPLLAPNNDLQISGDNEAELTLNGLLISGAALHIGGRLQTLRLRHCTLVPGISLKIDGTAQQPEKASLVIEVEPGHPLTVEIDHCITGPLRLPAEGVQLTIRDSIIDAPPLKDQSAVALAASDDGLLPGPATTMERTTVMGTVHVKELTLTSNCIFTDPVVAEQRQAGCARFSFVPTGSQTPRRYRCQPDLAIQQATGSAQSTTTQQNQLSDAIRAWLQPDYTSKDYGQPAFGQLGGACPLVIRTGADDGAEMGAFHDLFQPQREANLRARLNEFLRFSLEAGIFYATQSIRADK